MFKVIPLAGVIAFMLSTATFADERNTFEKEFQTANGKVAVSFSHPTGFKVVRNAEEGAVLARLESSQALTIVCRPQPKKDGELQSAEQLQELLIKQVRQMTQAQQVELDFLEKGPAYTLTGGDKALSVLFAIKISDEKGELQFRMRIWHQIVVRDGQLCELQVQWMLTPDTQEIQQGTPQSRMVKQFKETFESLTIKDVE